MKKVPYSGLASQPGALATRVQETFRKSWNKVPSVGKLCFPKGFIQRFSEDGPWFGQITAGPPRTFLLADARKILEALTSKYLKGNFQTSKQGFQDSEFHSENVHQKGQIFHLDRTFFERFLQDHGRPTVKYLRFRSEV